LSYLRQATRHFRYVLLAAGVASSAATAIATVPGSLATNRAYSCASCRSVPGPNDRVRNNEAINYTRFGVAARLWKSNGEFVQEAFSSGSRALVCHAAGEFFGHGDAAERSGLTAHLAGREDNYASCG
jgi:hypothetical protein